MLVATSHCVVVEHNYERVALSFLNLFLIGFFQRSVIFQLLVLLLQLYSSYSIEGVCLASISHKEEEKSSKSLIHTAR